MFDTMQKLMLAGLGAMSMTKERAEQVFEEYVRRGQAQNADRQGFVKDMLDAAERTRADMEEMIRKQVHQAVEKLNLATKEDVVRVELKVEEMLARLPGAVGGSGVDTI